MSKICVVGTGYVGLVTGTCLADLGNTVICLDVDAEKIARLKCGELPIYEPGLEELVKRNYEAGRLIFTTNYAEAVPEAEFAFIAVGTPQGEDGSADLKYVEMAAESIAKVLKGHTIIINKSTVPIGTGDWVASILERSLNDSSVEATFEVVSNPEFLREGSAVFDFMNPDRIVLGSTKRAAAEMVSSLYSALKSPIIITDLRTAEMIKYASNAILATRISFINEIAQICDTLGADVKVVAEGMGYDKRIGPQFLQAGIGYGGSCFPKDVKALAHMAATHNCHPQLLLAVMDINQDARRLFVQKIERKLGSVTGRRIAVWGLAFKPNTDDMREAPALDIITALVRKGAEVIVYDPVAMKNARMLLPGAVEFCNDPYTAVTEAEAVLLLTEWNEFKQVNFQKVKKLMHRLNLFDGRNLYDPEEMRRFGFNYEAIGRPDEELQDSSSFNSFRALAGILGSGPLEMSRVAKR
ncbi:MAG: UDP-glucose/GDP-mannose dehydrogenase family protein [Chloroflexi bacterium]|uniref:UDP-glucose 6-dehydrogenase n=1 Tax=Candidatus Chlorohelix allophototropha TaxID=3003348 RepID=A0A8T7LX43_9CHLR|nr:UDP-glucose/GDP-mannose dehydrogenase family protein [Chloroflexota bacterium]WJW67310.1 UDP-glucose/GDP-mannose dehydrogenase family protein [Chloroflexota bacterium L227-S17]